MYLPKETLKSRNHRKNRRPHFEPAEIPLEGSKGGYVERERQQLHQLDQELRTYLYQAPTFDPTLE